MSVLWRVCHRGSKHRGRLSILFLPSGSMCSLLLLLFPTFISSIISQIEDGSIVREQLHCFRQPPLLPALPCSYKQCSLGGLQSWWIALNSIQTPSACARGKIGCIVMLHIIYYTWASAGWVTHSLLPPFHSGIPCLLSSGHMAGRKLDRNGECFIKESSAHLPSSHFPPCSNP